MNKNRIKTQNRVASDLLQQFTRLIRTAKQRLLTTETQQRTELKPNNTKPSLLSCLTVIWKQLY